MMSLSSAIALIQGADYGAFPRHRKLGIASRGIQEERTMAVLSAKALAHLIVRLTPLLIEASQSVKKWMKKEDIPKGDIPARLERLEKNLELQEDLNEQFVAEMEIVKPALEQINRSIRYVLYIALLACLLSVGSVVLILLK